MKGKFAWLIVSCLMVAALVLASCKAPVVTEKEVKGVVTEGEKKEEKAEEVVKEKSKYGGIISIYGGEDMISVDPVDFIAGRGWWSAYYGNSLAGGDWWADRAISDYTDEYTYLQTPEVWVGHLAESWEKPNDTTIIFNIRKGIRWQNKPPANGREVVAEDIVKWFERCLTAPAWAGSKMVQYMESITATDKLTVVVKTNAPYALMFSELAFWPILAPDVWETYGDMRDWKNQVGTGPFIWDDYVKGSSATYSRNPDYWDKDPDGNQLPYVDGVRLLIIPDASTQIAALRTGKVDLTNPWDYLQWHQRPSLEATNPEMKFNRTLPTVAFAFFQRQDLPPLSDINVRKALSMAMNREEIIATSYGGYGDPFTFPAQPTWGAYTPLDELPAEVREQWEHHPEKAKELMIAAGYPDGFDLTVQYNVTGRWAVYEPVMELVQAYWKKTLNVNLKLTSITSAMVSQIKKSKEYDGIFAAPTGQYDPLRFAQNNYGSGGSFNRSHVSDPTIDTLAAKAAGTMDEIARTEILKELYQYMSKMIYDFSLPGAVSFSAWHPWVKGYNGELSNVHQGTGHTLAYIWLDQELRKEMVGR